MQDSPLEVHALAREFVRALRGTQSQRAASLRLGYRTNVFYTWESGSRSPRAAEMFRLIRLRGLGLDDALSRLTNRSDWPDELTDEAWVRETLHRLRGTLTFAELVARTGIARCTLSRWFNGHAQPRLPEFFALVEACSLRVVDFIVDLVGASAVPSAGPRWRELEARRHIAWSMPWSHALLRALELAAYQRLPAHLPGWLAGRLGISRTEEERCLEALETARLIARVDNRYQVTERTVDTGTPAPEGARLGLKHHWHQVAERHLLDEAEGYFSYNLFSVSTQDLAILKQKHVAYFQDLRRVVAASRPAEHVMLLQLQLFELSSAKR